MSKKLFLWMFIIIGIVVGVYHFRFGMRALFVFRENEPLTSWLTIIFGPLSTLPAVIISSIKKRIGSIWLITGSIISFTSLAIEDNFKFNHLVPLSFVVFIPMIVIGIGILLADKKSK